MAVGGSRTLERRRRHRRRRGAARPFDLAEQRVHEINALIRHRHGLLPDTDDASIYIQAAALHWRGEDRQLKVERFCEPLGRVRRGWMVDEALAERPRWLGAEDLASMLRLTYAERTAIGIKTIGAIDADAEQRKELRRERERERLRRKRIEAGKVPRTAYLAAHRTSRDQPWLKLGISRRTWYRRQRTADAGTGLSGVSSSS